MILRLRIVCALVLAPGLMQGIASGKSSSQSSSDTAKQSAKPAPNHAESNEDGNRVFEQNCSRCHTAPDGFSSRISGTVVRHMRVRAGLSENDERALLHFLNP